MTRLAVATVVLVALALPASSASADDITGTIVFARGGVLIKADAKGKGESELAKLPAKAVVRALRTDAQGKILLADLDGTWSWMPLDGSTKTLTDLPCDPGPAQLDEDGVCVLCRHKKKTGGIIIALKTGKITPVDLPVAGARLAGVSTARKLVWADDKGVWIAPPGNLKAAKQVAKEPPLRAFSPSPDGSRAIGVYKADVYKNIKTKTQAEVLMVFALDGEAARRKTIQNGIAIDWSHDSKWVLVQDRASACIALATGGQYKCWRNYTAGAISADGKYALVFGNRKADKKPDKSSKHKKQRKPPPPKDPDDESNPESEADEHSDEPPPTDDVPVEPPSGPQSLYRAQLEGAYASSPALVSKVVDGAAVWIPTPPQ